MTRGRVIVVGGHSRGVGKTALVVALVRSLGWPRLATVKVSAHRHGAGPALVEDREPSPFTSTGRCLIAGATRAFLCRCPDTWLPAADALVRALLAEGWDVVVESNRMAAWLDADLTWFVVSAATDDWKASSIHAARRADVVVLAPGTEALPSAAWQRVDGASNPRVLRFADDWSVPGLEPWISSMPARGREMTRARRPSLRPAVGIRSAYAEPGPQPSNSCWSGWLVDLPELAPTSNRMFSRLEAACRSLPPSTARCR